MILFPGHVRHRLAQLKTPKSWVGWGLLVWTVIEKASTVEWVMELVQGFSLTGIRGLVADYGWIPGLGWLAYLVSRPVPDVSVSPRQPSVATLAPTQNRTREIVRKWYIFADESFTAARDYAQTVADGAGRGREDGSLIKQLLQEQVIAPAWNFPGELVRHFEPGVSTSDGEFRKLLQEWAKKYHMMVTWAQRVARDLKVSSGAESEVTWRTAHGELLRQNKALLYGDDVLGQLKGGFTELLHRL